MRQKPLRLAAVSLAIAVLAVLPMASERLPGLVPFDGRNSVQTIPTPKTDEQDYGSIYSQLVWTKGFVTYDGYGRIDVERTSWPSWLESFSIESNAWVIHVTKDSVDVSWLPDPNTKIFVVEGDPLSSGGDSLTGNSDSSYH